MYTCLDFADAAFIRLTAVQSSGNASKRVTQSISLSNIKSSSFAEEDQPWGCETCRNPSRKTETACFQIEASS
jgi:hypothetical protein